MFNRIEPLMMAGRYSMILFSNRQLDFMVLHWKDDPHMDDQNTNFLFIYFYFFLLLTSNLYFTFVCLD